MLEKLKAEGLLAYQELNKYGLNKYARVSYLLLTGKVV